MSKFSLKQIGWFVLLIAALLIAVIGLNVITNPTGQTAQQETKRTLRVALVNEDQPITKDDKTYQLGSSYIKSIERDTEREWTIVSRGTAEAGLEDGTYQLVVYIPSDFSSKILDVTNTAVDKTTVSYKVNAQGNSQLESEAFQVGEQVVADLNTKLVDVYLASILNNLYTAQQDVSSLYEKQATNVSTFQRAIYPSSISAPNVFPNLQTQSSSALTSNQGLVDSLTAYSGLFTGLETSQATFSSQLENLLSQSSSNQVSYEGLVASLMTMNHETIATDMEAIIAQLQNSQQTVTTGLGISDTKESPSDYEMALGELDTAYSSLETLVKDIVDKLPNDEAELETVAKEALATYYKKEPADLSQLTYADVLNLSSDTVHLADVKGTTQTVLNQLPSTDEAMLKSQLTLIDPSAADNISLDATNLSDFSRETVNGDLASRLETAYTAYREVEDKVSSGSADGTLTLTDPEGIVESWVVNGQSYSGEEKTVSVKSDTVPTISLNYAKTVSIEVDPEANPDDKEAKSFDIKGNVQVSYAAGGAAIDWKDYADKKAAYAALVAEVQGAYKQANLFLTLYNGVKGADNALNESAEPFLVNLTTTLLSTYYPNYATMESDLLASWETLNKEREELQATVKQIQANNTTVSSDIQSLLATFSKLKDQATAADGLISTNTTNTSQTSSELTALNGQLASLMAQTTGVKTSAESNATQAAQVNETFAQFNQSVATAQTDSQSLATSAEELLGSFETELENSGNVVDAFTNVLSNAYANGVPNETVLDFLSQPVLSKASSVKTAGDRYRPFTWILLLEVVTLFAAYLFATQDMLRKVKDRFTDKRLANLDWLNTTILTGVALLIGISLGVLSAQQLKVEAEFTPVWVTLVTLFSLLLTQGQYALLKQVKTLGMGIILFMLISYVYLTNAIGTATKATGVTSLLKRVNPLMILEDDLTGYLAQQGAGAGIFALVILLTLAVMGINMILGQQKTKMME